MCVYYLGRDFEFHLPRPVARKLFAAARAALAMLVAASAVYAQGGWKELAPVSCPSPVPCPSEGMTVGGVGEMIIGVYGFSRFSRLVGGDQRLTRLYHINRNSWSLGAPAPAPALQSLPDATRSSKTPASPSPASKPPVPPRARCSSASAEWGRPSS